MAARTGRVAHAAVARHHCAGRPYRSQRVPRRLLGEKRASDGQTEATGVVQASIGGNVEDKPSGTLEGRLEGTLEYRLKGTLEDNN